GLQFSLEAEAAALHFFPVTSAEKLSRGGDSGVVQTQIDSNHFLGRSDIGLRNRDDDMQPELSFTKDQISRADRSTSVLCAVGRDGKRNALLACYCREADRLSEPIQGIGMLIIANRTGLTMRALDRLEDRYRLASLVRFGYLLRIAPLMFLLPGESTLQGFGRLDTSLNEQIRNQARTL